MFSECVGCESYESYLGNSCRLGIQPEINGIKCPCSICLVKSMCNGNICVDFMEYAKRARALDSRSFNPILYRLKKKGFKWRTNVKYGEKKNFFNNTMIKEAMKEAMEEEENESNK